MQSTKYYCSYLCSEGVFSYNDLQSFGAPKHQSQEQLTTTNSDDIIVVVIINLNHFSGSSISSAFFILRAALPVDQSILLINCPHQHLTLEY